MKKNYELWNIANERVYALSDVELLKSCAQFGALAPSTHNTQPWVCRIEDQSLIVSPDLTKQLPHADPANRGLNISLGCFVMNVRCAAAKFGKGVSSRIVDGAINLTLRQLESEDAQYALLFDQLTKRLSNKNYYDQEKIPRNLLDQLSVSHNGCVVYFNDDPTAIADAADQYRQSAMSLAETKEFRAELVRWLRPNFTTAFDGMPGFVANVPTIVSVLGPLVLPYSRLAAQKQVEKDGDKLQMSPAFGVIFSTRNTTESWIEVGEVYELVALLACSSGLSMTPMAALVEDQSGAKFLTKFQNNLLAQFVFRIGYSRGETPRHTPRRAIVFP